MEKVENRDVCAECGGYCCKKCGCDYFVSDLESNKIDYLESLLDTGRVSVIAAIKFKRIPNGNLTVEPILYLRARNINREAIDLLSLKTTCASLEAGGCHYTLERRPSGGGSLMPKKENGLYLCYPTVDRLSELKKWDKYQKPLWKIVQRRTGKNVYAKLKEDAENLFFDVLSGNTRDVFSDELYDMRKMMKYLIEVYSKEFTKAGQRVEKNKTMIMQKKY